MSDLPPPTPIALVLCDNVYRDSNGKHALIGLFHEIIATNIPAMHPKMCAYVSITSIRPNTRCSIDIISAETDEKVFELRGPTPDGLSPTDVWDLVFEFPPIVFPEAGRYYIRFFGGDRVLMSRPFEVVVATAIEKGDHDDNEK